MAHTYTVRHDGYLRWDFHDGSALTQWPNGQLSVT